MKRYSLIFLSAFALLLSIPFAVLAEGDSSDASDSGTEEEFCEKSGGVWKKEVTCLDPDYVKPGMEQCEEIWICECEEGYEVSEYGTCVEELDYGMMPEDKETCELGGGIWVELESGTGEEEKAVTGEGETDGEEVTDGEGIEETEITEEMGMCDCPEGMYWSQDNMCVAYEKEYLCSYSGGDWDTAGETCTCWNSEAVWDDNKGCEIEVVTTVTEELEKDKDVEVEDKEGITLQPVIIVAMMGGSFFVGMVLGLIFGKSGKSKGGQMPPIQQPQSVGVGQTY